MQSVCVIGGGTAGTEAAMEASRDGAQVTVVEKARDPELPWKAWPSLIQDHASDRGTAGGHLRMPSYVNLVAAEAKAVRGRSVLFADGLSARFDTVIAATGSGFAPPSVRGWRKVGVHFLCTSGAYSELGRHRGMLDRPVVTGEGARALCVADPLSGGGRRVTVVVSRWRHGAPSPDVSDVLRESASERGVSIAEGPVVRAVGDGRVEAVVVGGQVVPSDALVLLPDRVPKVVLAEARLGATGGFSVGRALWTSSPGLLAAGGCAELSDPCSSPRIFDEEPRMSGRIAGANSVGHCLAVSASSRTEAALFGLRWTVSEVDPGREGASGASRGVISRRWGPESACTITFDRRRGRVLRVECLEPDGNPRADPTASASWGTSLHSLAFADSSDISLVSDTARLGLRLWSDS